MIFAFQTDDIEAAVRSMARSVGHHILLRCGNYANLAPIRFRPSVIQDLEPIICRDRMRLEQLEKWRERGGVIAYQANDRAAEPLPEHGSQAMSETPDSKGRVEFFTRSTKFRVVIYRPPSWDEHYATIAVRRPHPDRCAYLLELIRQQADNKALCDSLGIEPGLPARDEYLQAHLDVGARAFQLVRKATMSPKWYYVVRPFKLRVRPADDAALCPLYDAIAQQPMIGAERMVVGTILGKAYANWRAGLRKLVRGGNIARSPMFGVYYLDGFKLKTDALMLRHLEAVRALDEVTSWVDSLPVFQTR